MSTLALAAVLMAAAVIAVPISKRLGLGSVLGYLAAGIVLGPAGLDVAGDVDSILHFAELGVVLLLFVIGLELQPSRLWTMRRPVFGLGGVQVMLTAAVLGLLAWFAGLSPATAVIVGLGLALSSTAFALQVMAERNELTTRYGRGAFSILLFQDLAVIPILALIPLLAVREGAAMDASGVLLAVGRVVVVIGAVVVGGRYLLRHVLRLVAATQIREVFTAMALLTVVGTALLMEAVGLSMALGAFLAGVLLADSEYRHALEADIEPFKGLLLGLFFIAVGMSVDLGLLVAQPLTIAGIAVGLMAIKGAILYGLGRVYYRKGDSARRLALAISQGGEFAFVIFGFATGIGALERGVADILILAVTASMMATPLLLAIQDAVLRRVRAAPADEEFEMPEPRENRVIIAGFGRFGQIVGRLLRARKIGFTALESSAAQVDFVRRYGNKIYYGDPSRLDLLRAAKAESAEIFVVAVDDVEASVRTVETVQQYFPHLKIYARARNRPHAYRLMELGVDVIQRETFLSSLDVGRQVLEGLGFSPSEAERTTEMFRDHDVARLEAHFGEHRDEEKMMRLAGEWARELEELFEEDAAEEAAE
jgi:glutathione-regulated potassium-efflux system ancillary protein KefC/glutathione-regulated potassium-efflux system protein KefB